MNQTMAFGKEGMSLFGATAIRWAGTDWEVINIRITCDDSNQTWFHSLNELRVTLAVAEVKYAIRCEAMQTLADFFIRRTGRMYFDPQAIEKLIEPVAEVVAEHRGLDGREPRARLTEEQLEQLVLLLGRQRVQVDGAALGERGAEATDGLELAVEVNLEGRGRRARCA